jgi:hypothetical protein
MNPARFAFVLVAISITVLVPLSACTSPAAESGTELLSSEPARVEGTSSDIADSAATGGRFVKGLDPLHDPQEPGVSLDEALKAISQDVPLPAEEVVGKVVKVLFAGPDPGDEDEGYWSLAVLYSSGLELFIDRHPYGEEVDIAADVESSMRDFRDGSVTYTDGKQHHFLETIGDKPVHVQVGGVQGPKGGPGFNDVSSYLTWNQTGLRYSLRGPTHDSKLIPLMREVVESTGKQ